MTALPHSGEFALPPRFLETEAHLLEAILCHIALTGCRYLTIRGRSADADFGQAEPKTCARAYEKASALLRFAASSLPEYDERRLARLRLADTFCHQDRANAPFLIGGLCLELEQGGALIQVQGPLVKISQDQLYAHLFLSLLAPSERKMVELVGHALFPLCFP